MSMWARQKKLLEKSVHKVFKLQASYTKKGSSSAIPLSVKLLTEEVEVESDGGVVYAEAIGAEFLKSQISELKMGDSFVCLGEKYDIDVVQEPGQATLSALVVKKGAA